MDYIENPSKISKFHQCRYSLVTTLSLNFENFFYQLARNVMKFSGIVLLIVLRHMLSHQWRRIRAASWLEKVALDILPFMFTPKDNYINQVYLLVPLTIHNLYRKPISSLLLKGKLLQLWKCVIWMSVKEVFSSCFRLCEVLSEYLL